MTKAPSARLCRLELRMSDELHDELRMAAAKTAFGRKPSVSLLVREVLRDRFGMPSTDGGRTLEALAAVRGPVVTEGDSEPEPRQEARETPSQTPARAAETVPEANVESEPRQEALETPPPAARSTRQKLMHR